MRRVRLAFVLLVIGLAIPMGLLIQRALGGVQIEREAQNRAVAERVFDEMERVLTDFLQAEDERSTNEYSFYYTPDGAPNEVQVRSPLSETPEEPFVVGYFEIGVDGIIRTPLIPEDPGVAKGRGDFELSLERETRATRILEVASRLDLGEGRIERRFPPLRSAQAPATTRRVASRDGKGSDAVGPAEDVSSDAYVVLQQLNRGARERAEREKKVVTEKSVPYGGFADSIGAKAPGRAVPAEPEADALAFDASSSPSEVFEAQPIAEEAPPRAAALAQGEVLRQRLEALPGAAERLAALATAVTVDPFLGRPAPEGLLVLMRTVLVGQGAVRQGIVIDVEELLGHLRENTFGEGTLEGAALELGFAGDLIGRERPRYRHRFGEPFDTLTVDLLLAPLGDVAGGRAVFLLSALSLGVMGLALFALYRMVAVTVSFAERRSNFVAAVSHELKTPLTAIRMYGEMLRDDLVPSGEKRDEYYRSITAESERLSRLINNVLEFSRLEHGTRGVELRVGDITPAVKEAIELLAPHAEQRGKRLELALDPDLPDVRFEHDALLQVLFNLIDNALKYAPNALEPVIEVGCRKVPGGIELSVRDHGPGVSSAHAPRILEAFYRGENELTRRTQGTGIGLALVKGLAEEMGARLTVGNAPGGGFRAALKLASA